VVVLTLALGIGANTAVFSVLNTVLFRPLPYPQSERLVQMWSTNANTNRWGIWTAYPRFADWRRLATAFEEMAAVRFWVVNLSGGDHPEALDAVLVSSRLFQVLRVQPMLGRAFLPEEDQPGHDHVIILSYGSWERRFASDAGVIGRPLSINRQSYTVIGVMPAGFRFPPDLPPTKSIDAWLPPSLDPDQNERGSNNYYVVARYPSGTADAVGCDQPSVADRLR
jgi:putative ABC transport system permease protein